MEEHKEGLLSPLLRARRFSAAAPFLSGRIADLGCGIGRLAEHVPAENYVGIDTDLEVLENARQRFPRHRFVTVEESASLDAGSFDTVACLAVVEHLEEPAELLEAARRLLKPGGKLVLTTPHPSLEFVHTLGAWLRLFSREAAHDHEELLDRRQLHTLLKDTGFEPVEYRRFMLRANQLIVAARPGEHAQPATQGA